MSATPILWSRLLKNAPPTSMYEEVAPAASTLAAAAGAGARKGSSKGSAARDEVSASVAAAVRAVIGADVEPDASLMASGLDSLGSVVSAGWGCLTNRATLSIADTKALAKFAYCPLCWYTGELWPVST